MFKIGFGEILLLGLLALVFLNPRELPKLFHKAGQLFARLRRFKREFDETMSRFEEEVKRSEEAYKREESSSAKKSASPGGERSDPDPLPKSEQGNEQEDSQEDSQEGEQSPEHERRAHDETSNGGMPPEEYRNRTKED